MRNEDGLTYLEDEPNVKELRRVYTESSGQLSSYFDLCRQSYDDRRNWWPGKTRDLRKKGADAFPWEGASDLESHVIDERCSRLAAMIITAVRRSNIKAYPVESKDMAKARVVSNFLKWMVNSGYIANLSSEMEMGVNYWLERGIVITYVGWKAEDRQFLQQLDINAIREANPGLAAAIMRESSDDRVVPMLQKAFNGVDKKRAEKALKDLRAEGVAMLPIVRKSVNAPEIRNLASDGEWIFPPYVTDPQKAPYGFWRTFMTPQELKLKVATEEWDESWVDYVIEHHKGVKIDTAERRQEGTRSTNLSESVYEAEELIEVIYAFQRLIDKSDNSEGIYRTIFNKDMVSSKEVVDVPRYAKFELYNGFDDYPIEVTKFSDDSKRLYDVMTVPSLLRGIQNQIKVERDSRMDRNSMATLPPLLHPPGEMPPDWGPGRKIPARRKDQFKYADKPEFDPGSIEIERTLQEQADRLLGLDEDSSISLLRRQFIIDKFLEHFAKVLKLAYKCFQRFGPDSIYFRVTGVPDPQRFEKGNGDEDYDITVTFDSLNSDPDIQEKKLNQLVSLMQIDRNGRIDPDSLIAVIANSIDPTLADGILRESQEGRDQAVRDVLDDLSKIYSGIELNARPNGASIALSVIDNYFKQPDVAQRLQEDESFKARIEKYAMQYQFQIQQAQNAEIGKIGTAPAQMGGMRPPAQ